MMAVRNPDNFDISILLQKFEESLFDTSLEDVTFCSKDVFWRDFVFCLSLYFFYWVLFSILFTILYFVTAWFGFHYFYDKSQLTHPLFMKNQIWREIMVAFSTLIWTPPMVMVLWIPMRLGYSGLNWDTNPSVSQELFTMLKVLIFADGEVYWWHRFAHSPLMYKLVHKKHHQFVVPTPYASYAFHPIDSLMTGLPYMIGCYFLRMHVVTFISLLAFSHFSAFGVHEGYFDVCAKFQNILIGSAYHNNHHKFLIKNFGHITTFWDVLCGTSRFPSSNSEIMFVEKVQPKPKTFEVPVAKKPVSRVLSAEVPRICTKPIEVRKEKLCRKLSILTAKTSRRIT